VIVEQTDTQSERETGSEKTGEKGDSPTLRGREFSRPELLESRLQAA